MSEVRFKNEEMAVMSLSNLYERYGFRQFKMRTRIFFLAAA